MKALKKIINNRAVLCAFAAGLCLVTLYLGVQNAQAADLSPDPVCCVPDGQYNFLKHADDGPNYARLTIWVSDQAPPSTAYKDQTVNATAGQTTPIPLSFSYAGAVGNVNNRAKVSRAKVTSAPDTNGLLNSTLTIGWGNDYQKVGAYDHEGKGFTYQEPGGITNGAHTITVKIRQVIEYDNGVFECVTPSGVPPFQVSSPDQIGSCPEASTPLSFYVNAPDPEYDHRAQLKLDTGSPVDGEVSKGIEYTLYPRVRNVGPDKSSQSHLMAVQSLNPTLVNRVGPPGGIGDLEPANKQTNIMGALKGYREGEPACNPNNTTPSTCWGWGFTNLAPGNEVKATFKFKLDDSAQNDDQVCFLPFVRRRGRNQDVHVGDQQCFKVVEPNCPAGADFTGPIADQPNRDGDPQKTAADCYNPADKTYLSVYGNDVSVGGGFGAGCTIKEATIESYTDSQPAAGGATAYKGASSQFAALAQGSIIDFFTANMRGPSGTTGLPRPPLDLTFGNTSTDTEKVGANQGGFSGNRTCIKDYFADADTVLPSGTISTTSVPAGSHQAHYYQGNVYINGTGITFDGADTSWGGSVDNIPSYKLVVKGNIYIDPSVTRLDGMYIARPNDDGSGGEIITCANSLGVTPAHGGCPNKLVINGSFIARQVRFKREFGKLSEAVPNEGPADSHAGEVFNFSPEVFLSPMKSGKNTTLPFTKYDYITSLPPVL